MARHLPRRYWIRLRVSLVIALALAVPLLIVGVTAARRHAMLNGLASPDPATREQSLNTLILETPSDARLRQRVAKRLPRLPDDAVLQVYQALSHADTLGTPELQGAWLEVLGDLEPPALITLGSRLPSDDDATRDAVSSAVLPHLDTVTDEVQRDQLVALLDLHRAWTYPPVPIQHYAQWLDRGIASPSAQIRRGVALSLADLPIADGPIDPQHVQKRLERLLADPEPEVRAAALWATAGYVPEHPAIYLPYLESARQDPDERIARFAQRVLDIWHVVPNPTYPSSPVPSTTSSTTTDWSSTLSMLDLAPLARLDVKLDPSMPHLVRIAVTRVSTHAQPDWLLDTLRLNDRSATRDLACVTLAHRFSRNELTEFIHQLLTDHDPEARASGAILSGLTRTALDELDTAEAVETDPAIRRLMSLGRWMQNPRDGLDGQAQAMLGREGLPESTLLLAMLQRGQGRAVLDHLLGVGLNLDAQDDSLAGVPAWLWGEQWVRVLVQYLPDNRPPPVDADPRDITRYFERYRAWHALLRHRVDQYFWQYPGMTNR